MNGIINIYKERGYTSHDVVARLRGITKQKKIGHTGTLDPDAEGVLPVCFGNATKLCDLITDRSKAYEADMLLGISTDTQDMTGDVIKTGDITEISDTDIENAVKSFVGEYDQLPPMYSAVQVNGQRLYTLARQGKEVERETRQVSIRSIDILGGCERGVIREGQRVIRLRLRINCSKGTYIRTLCNDIGEKLQCGGCIENLYRTAVGEFRMENSLRLAEVERLVSEGRLEEHLKTSDMFFPDYPCAMMRAECDRILWNGNELRMSDFYCICDEPEQLPVQKDEQGGSDGSVDFCNSGKTVRPQNIRVYDSNRNFYATYEWQKRWRKYKPLKMFPCV